MSNRRRDRDRDQKDDRRDEAPKPRMSTFFVPGTGIDREVITTDICRYLGNDALVKPGPYQDPRTGEVRQGYYVTAYRALTTEQLADLKADSLRWQQERQRNPAAGRAAAGDGYRGSQTRRQQWGSSDQGADYQGSGFPQKAQPEPSYGQPQYSPQAGYSSGMQPPSAGYPRTEGGPSYSMETGQNYPGYARNPTVASVSYPIQQPRSSEVDPRSSYPSSAGYPSQDQGGRGIPPTAGYPGSTYAPYSSDPSGVLSAGAGRQAPQPGMTYESSYGQPPVDPRYGRSQPGGPPGTEEGYGDTPMDYEDDDMEDEPTGSGYATQQSREARPSRDSRGTPPIKSSRTHHSDRDRHGRR